MRRVGQVKDQHGGNIDSEEICLGAFKGLRTPSVSQGDTWEKVVQVRRTLTLSRSGPKHGCKYWVHRIYVSVHSCS